MTYEETKLVHGDHSGKNDFRYEGMPDLIWLLNTLVDKEGNILVEGLLDDVAPVAANENAIYEQITFSPAELRHDVGCKKLRHNEDKVLYLYYP